VLTNLMKRLNNIFSQLEIIQNGIYQSLGKYPFCCLEFKNDMISCGIIELPYNDFIAYCKVCRKRIFKITTFLLNYLVNQISHPNRETI